MGFLKNLFGGNKQPASDKRPPSDNPLSADAFDRDWFAAVERFRLATGMESFQFKIKHPKTMKVMLPREGLAGSFADWREISSAWDRRALLLDMIFGAVGRSLKPWYASNILVALRRPHQALKVISAAQMPPTDNPDYAAYCEAYARALQYMQTPHEALEWARKAYAAAPANGTKLRLADALYMTGACDEAYRMYNELMTAGKPPGASKAAISAMFANVFALETGSVPSPIFAIDLAGKLTSPAQAAEFWALGEAEFYDSPYFRMHHAYALLKQGETPRALAKLASLAQDMPWLREPAVNLDIIFKQIDPSGTTVMPELQQQIRQRIRENNWTTEGMHKIDM